MLIALLCETLNHKEKPEISDCQVLVARDIKCAGYYHRYREVNSKESVKQLESSPILHPYQLSFHFITLNFLSGSFFKLVIPDSKFLNLFISGKF